MHSTHTPSSITRNPAEKHTFSSKERDAETGLSYFGVRYYSSDLSIWLSVDPMVDKYPSLSPYTYCANNPVKLVDPNGEEWTDIDGKIILDHSKIKVNSLKNVFKNMKTISTVLIMLFSPFCIFGQNPILNNNVIILGEIHFENPISVALKKDLCHSGCDNYNAPTLLLMEKTFLDTIMDYTELSVFNQNCYEYTWYFFPRLVRDHIIPYMDKKSKLYKKVDKAYPNLWTLPFEDTVGEKINKGSFNYREVVPHDFMIVLMNAKTYNEYRSNISPPQYYYKDAYEENGIYFKVAIPLPENNR